jgi:nucleoside-diphosphate-sugar epimerase
MKPEAKIVFVTGGTGFVGSHLVEALLAEGYEVRCLVRNKLGWLEGLPITPVQGDLFDKAAIDQALEGVSYVFHVGGLTRSRQWQDFEDANVTATLRLLEATERHRERIEKIVVVSSQAAAGASDFPLTEDKPMKPVSMYGKSKALMEEKVHPFMDRLPISIVRPPSVYGAREADIFAFIKTANQGFCPIVGDGVHPQLNIVYVHDLVRGMIQVAHAARAIGETYFLGSATDASWHEIRDAVCSALNKKVLTIHLPVSLVKPLGALVETTSGWFGQYPPLNREKAAEAQYSWRISIAKAQQQIGYNPTTDLQTGMKETVNWYKMQRWL